MPSRSQHARASAGRRASFQVSSKRRDRRVVDLAEVVIEARDLEPVAVGVDHAPPREVVERGAPQHRLLAAGVHRDVAADARGVGRRRVDREHEPRGSAASTRA